MKNILKGILALSIVGSLTPLAIGSVAKLPDFQAICLENARQAADMTGVCKDEMFVNTYCICMHPNTWDSACADTIAAWRKCVGPLPMPIRPPLD